MLKRGLFLVILLFYSISHGAVLQEEAIELEPIVVSRQEGIFSNALTPLEELRFFPLDLQARSPIGAIQSDLSLRASNFQEVLFLFEGRRINDPQTAHHNFDIPVTKADVKRIELLPGISSALYGPDAVGGALNVIINKPTEDKIVLASSFGSFNTKSGLFSLSEKKDALGLRLSLENQESDGFYEDTDFKKFTATLNTILEFPEKEFNAYFGYQEKEFGAFDFYTPAMGFLSKEWTKTFLTNIGMKMKKEDFFINPNFLWRRHYDKFLLDKTLTRSTYLNHHRTDIFTPNIYFQKDALFLDRLGLGLEAGEERISSTNLGKHSRFHKSIYFDAKDELLPQAELSCSGRIDDFSGFENSYTGSLHLDLKLSDENSLNFGISRSIRLPSFTELYYSDPTTVGNPALSQQETANYQVGYEYSGELALGTVFFLRSEKDSIDWIKKTFSQERWQAENISGQKIFGLENYLKLDINSYLNINANYAYASRKENKGAIRKYGPNYSRHLVSLKLFSRLQRLNYGFALIYKKKPKRDGWLLADIKISYSMDKNSELFFSSSNLLNVEYQEIEGIPQPGRYLEAGMRIEW